MHGVVTDAGPRTPRIIVRKTEKVMKKETKKGTETVEVHPHSLSKCHSAARKEARMGRPGTHRGNEEREKVQDGTPHVTADRGTRARS